MSLTGIFGGSFNPIHNGHIQLARQLRCMAGLAEVWFMVSPQNPLKQASSLAPEALRLRMAQAALAHEDGLEACGYELRMPRPSYTWLTLCALRRDYPDRQFALLIGADNWACFDSWRDHGRILATTPIIVYPRAGSEIDASALPPGVTLADTELFNVSSTCIRRRVREGKSVTGLVPPAVEDIIRDEGVYKG